MDDLIAIGLANNPTLAQAQARVQAARGAWQQAGRPRNPRIGYQGAEIGNEGQSGLQGGFVEQEFTTGGKLALAQAVAARQVAQAQQEYEAQRQRVINDVRTLFYLALVADLQVQTLREFEAALGTIHELYQRSQTQGEISPSDQIIFEYSAQLPFHLSFLGADVTQVNVRRQLSAVVGVPQMEIGALVGDPREGWPEYDWQTSLDRVLNLSPQLAAAGAAVARAQAAVALQRRMVIPNVELQVGVQHDNTTSDDVTNVQAAVPLPLFNKNRGAIRQAEAQLVAAQANVSRVELNLHRRLADAFERYARAKRLVKTLKPRVEHLKRAYDRRRAAERAGEFSALENLLVQRTQFEMSAAYLEALRELWSSAVAIDGLLLSGGLDAPGSEGDAVAEIPSVTIDQR